MNLKSLALALSLAASPLALAQTALAADYQVDAGHSAVNFKLSYANVSTFWGRFNKFEGRFTFDASDLGKAKVEISIEADSVFTADKKRDDHLRSPDFFSAKQFPKITFTSTSVKAGSKAGTFIASGNLTLRGVTKPVTVELVKTGEGKDGYGKERIGFEATFTINRLDYGVNFAPDGLGKDVTVIVGISGVKS
ncbi:MAG TPA: YceI family protein [Myxococcota bacterium]|nr:YceI family protein [Myxococcota bacterium]